MNPAERAPIGSTSLRVTRLGLGGAPLGGLFASVEHEGALATVRAAYDAGVRYFDTAPLYGHGTGEMRMGEVLAGTSRDDFVLSTKVGRVLVPAGPDGIEDHAYRNVLDRNPVFDLSASGIRRSLEESLERLGLDRIDIALLHDPDDHYRSALAQAFPELVRMREEGLVTAIGAGMNQWEMLLEFLVRVDLDCVLLAGRYTLLDRSAEAKLLPECERRGVSVLLGGPYNSGVLAGGDHYDYEDVPENIMRRTEELRGVCQAHRVPLKAAALQFPLRHPAVTSVLAGARSEAELRENVEMMSYPIDPSFWEEV